MKEMRMHLCVLTLPKCDWLTDWLREAIQQKIIAFYGIFPKWSDFFQNSLTKNFKNNFFTVFSLLAHWHFFVRRIPNGCAQVVSLFTLTFSTRLKHLCSDRLWRTAFWRDMSFVQFLSKVYNRPHLPCGGVPSEKGEVSLEPVVNFV